MEAGPSHERRRLIGCLFAWQGTGLGRARGPALTVSEPAIAMGSERETLARLLLGRPFDVAPHLLGRLLSVGTGPLARSGRIVEVEAYEGPDDPASHAFRGPTDRNRIMFGPSGKLYVYQSYGVHWCANIVCGPVEEPGAVLIRAVEPVDGMDAMWVDRPSARRVVDLASGPGKLCAALGVGRGHNGADLLSPAAAVRLGAGQVLEADQVVAGPRIGISRATERLWRFAESGNPHVSRPRPPRGGSVAVAKWISK